MEVLLKGLGASAGVATGNVKIIEDTSQISKMEQGNILVMTMTTPLFTSAILKASAVVTDLGGYLSHAAIVSRELGIPCVVGTEKATQTLIDGQEVTVDGKQGIVYG